MEWVHLPGPDHNNLKGEVIMADGTVQESIERNKKTAKSVEVFDQEAWRDELLAASAELQQFSTEKKLEILDGLINDADWRSRRTMFTLMSLSLLLFNGFAGLEALREKLPLEVRQAEFHRIVEEGGHDPETISAVRDALFGKMAA